MDKQKQIFTQQKKGLSFFPKHVSSNFISFNKLNEKAALEIFLLQIFKEKHAGKKKKNMILHHTENSYKNKRQNLEVKLMWKMKKLLVDIMALDLKKKKGQAKHI